MSDPPFYRLFFPHFFAKLFLYLIINHQLTFMGKPHADII